MKFIEISPVEIRVNVKGLTQTRAAITSWLFRRERPRYAVSGIVSLIVHVFCISSFMVLSVLHEPQVLEIREFSFVDLTEEPVVKAPPKEIARSEERKHPAGDLIVNPESQSIKVKPDVTPTRLDMVREQPRMQLAGLVRTNLSDALVVSSAKGTSKDDKVSNLAAPIALARSEQIAAGGSSGKISRLTGGGSGAQISLDRKGTNVSAGGGVVNGSGKGEIQSQDPAAVEPTPQTGRQSSVTITGPLGNRGILERVIPPFPVWAKRQGVGANVSLQFTVMENGVVKENVVVVMTSGSKEWDDAVIAALKKWRFAPLNSGEGRQNQSGVIRFQFVID
jgi:TonB family protein